MRRIRTNPERGSVIGRNSVEESVFVERSITLRADRYGGSAYYLRAHIRRDGALVIEGHDLGVTPKQFWGSIEYEWEIAIPAGELPALVDALGGTPGADPLDLLAVRYGEDERVASRAFLEERAITFEFSSRVGD